MAFSKGDQVFVPRQIIGLDPNNVSPFYYTTIRERVPGGRSVRIDLPNGGLSDPISTKKISRSFGVLIVRIGDFHEDGLLRPLSKSVLNYASMLLPGDSVRLVELRTTSEFDRLWRLYHGMCEQLIIVGHGYEHGLVFGDDEVPASSFRQLLEAPNPSRKEVLSLACKTGYAGIGQELSASPIVSHFMAPFHSVHGCVASLFASTYLHERLLAHYSAKVAFKHARKDLLGAASFRLWENGSLAIGPK